MADLTEMQDDEIYHRGQSFHEELKNVVDKYRPYFFNHFYYKELEIILGYIKRQLHKENRIAE